MLPSKYELQSTDCVSNTKELRSEMMTVITRVNMSLTHTICQELHTHHFV